MQSESATATCRQKVHAQPGRDPQGHESHHEPFDPSGRQFRESEANASQRAQAAAGAHGETLPGATQQDQSQDGHDSLAVSDQSGGLEQAESEKSEGLLRVSGNYTIAVSQAH